MSLTIAAERRAQSTIWPYVQTAGVDHWVFATLVFILLMFTSIPGLYDLFNVDPARMEPLWTLGGR